MVSQSSMVQGLASSQLIGVLKQPPVLGSQASAVQALPSLQDLEMCAQPVFGSHESLVHSFWSSQSTGIVPATQSPALQCSPVVQALPSEQALVSSFVPRHPPSLGSQVSSVQALPSSQPMVGPATQVPCPLHFPIEQASVSEQSVPLPIFLT
jgi:hypothetical protein